MSTTRSDGRSKQQLKKSLRFFQRHRRLYRWLVGIFITVVSLVVIVWVVFQVSPWPNALLIRNAFKTNDAKVSEALVKHLPSGIASIEDQQYRPNDKDALLDVFYPAHAATLSTVVWVHGGAWVAGGKDDIDNYLKILASYGFTVVSIGYSLAPERQYPTPILQLNDALGYLQQHSQYLHVDTGRIALAGDSAGSQIVAQMSNIITSATYADDMEIQPKLQANDLRAVLLNCGAYDLALPDYNGAFGKFLHTVLWAYSGTKDFLHDSKLKTASVANYVTSNFPPTFITAGNVDPLLPQSIEFAQRLQSKNVPISELFYAANHQPQLNHEYQFDLDTVDGRVALEDMVGFLRQYDLGQ